METAYLSTPHAFRPEGQKPLVCVRHVSKQFGNGTLAVRDVNLSLGAGEFVSLLGRKIDTAADDRGARRAVVGHHRMADDEP